MLYTFAKICTTFVTFYVSTVNINLHFTVEWEERERDVFEYAASLTTTLQQNVFLATKLSEKISFHH